MTGTRLARRAELSNASAARRLLSGPSASPGDELKITDVRFPQVGTAHVENYVVSPTLLDPHPIRDILSSRELDALRGMAVGETYRQTGHRLHVTEETVHTYVKRLLRKLGARNRAQAVAIALRAHVI